ncbi:NUDIX domain-containing protein [Bacillus timonensis]|uniref:NUDIX domain-containing protein n=1 Tax=Bacillus timonensis TaxID=1033734 RepID=A0A4S3PKD5_9BACI|nr:NUDIX domain-containing protein [Bacillus timonensis]THE09859.1 NUDIX domain-containing protein [Bacillus timonensis]
MRDRGSVVLIKDKKVGLIKRNIDDIVYYVFPGGGVEPGESPQECAIREAYEELGVQVKIHECIGTVNYCGTQYFFLSEIIEGTFGTGLGEEFSNQNKNRGSYTPVWIKLDRLAALDVRPKEIVLKVQSRFV